MSLCFHPKNDVYGHKLWISNLFARRKAGGKWKYSIKDFPHTAAGFPYWTETVPSSVWIISANRNNHKSLINLLLKAPPSLLNSRCFKKRFLRSQASNLWRSDRPAAEWSKNMGKFERMCPPHKYQIWHPVLGSHAVVCFTASQKKDVWNIMNPTINNCFFNVFHTSFSCQG